MRRENVLNFEIPFECTNECYCYIFHSGWLIMPYGTRHVSRDIQKTKHMWYKMNSRFFRQKIAIK